MGANSSSNAASTPTKKDNGTKTPLRQSQYTNALNSMYIPDTGKTTILSSSSSESTSISEDSDKVVSKLKKDVKQVNDKPKDDGKCDPLKMLEGLTYEEKVKKSEEMLKQAWKHPHPSWGKITEVTKMQMEKTNVDGQVTEEVHREVEHDLDKIVYDIPLDNCHLRLLKNRVYRSCPDPWRRHGAHVKLCEIGGTMPENRTKNAKMTAVRKGTIPPPAPRTKPLQTVEDYMKMLKR